MRPVVMGDNPELVKSVRLGTGVGTLGADVPAGAAAAGIGTTAMALGEPSLPTTSCRLSAVKLIASPCGESGSGMRTGRPASAPATSEPVSGQT
jgi:hypothetical protein